MDLYRKFVSSVDDIKGADLVPDGIIGAGNFLRAGAVPLDAETDAGVCVSAGARSEVARIDDMDRENTALHDILVLKDRVHVFGFLS